MKFYNSKGASPWSSVAFRLESGLFTFRRAYLLSLSQWLLDKTQPHVLGQLLFVSGLDYSAQVQIIKFGSNLENISKQKMSLHSECLFRHSQRREESLINQPDLSLCSGGVTVLHRTLRFGQKLSWACQRWGSFEIVSC